MLSIKLFSVGFLLKPAGDNLLLASNYVILTKMESVSPSREEFSFWKNLILASLFFSITPIVILASLLSLFSIGDLKKDSVKTSQVNQVTSPKSGVRVYASLPVSFPSVSGYVEGADARKEIVRQYLASYNSPLEPYAPSIVDAADKNGLDFRLTTAIAQQESNLCKKIPPETNNCWGWGIHSEGTLGFSSFQDGIETVSAGIRKEYLDKGYRTIEEIMSKYTPLSPGSWAEGVNKFIAEME
ncbi:hypothetical protein A2129_02490 [Candidatus Woesebacteria bacterium GWC1_42_13]|uniref:Mannosyl-glycoprotein endo-beta-N-acetylglucosamidase-like domain-containing protein n=1 Tax=Candidatus Woesebacteria bacterium GWC1_42_13 TaxID=1802475 RepID=A0A1F7WV82_9BACT|nr:MAG: hypothetical protein A2129_02490 [Candidatus Woesebacteria bacterium GWC1_42_13]